MESLVNSIAVWLTSDAMLAVGASLAALMPLAMGIALLHP